MKLIEENVNNIITDISQNDTISITDKKIIHTTKNNYNKIYNNNGTTISKLILILNILI